MTITIKAHTTTPAKKAVSPTRSTVAIETAPGNGARSRQALVFTGAPPGRIR